MTPKHIIIGNGGAAIHAVLSLRAAGYDGELHQFTDDIGPAFNPMVAPYFLSGKTQWETCFPFGADFYKKYQVITHHGEKVISLDADASKIKTDRGGVFNYDKCLIATGARPVIPPVEGLRESPYALPLREPDTARNMDQILQKAKRVLILGASFVGVKLAEVFLKKGIKVLLVDIAPQLMPQGAHKKAAKHVETYLKKKGIEIRLECGLKKVENISDGAICHFPDGTVEKVDFIAVSAGIKPNIDFLNPDQVKINRAICTNHFMQTNIHNIFAAGDVCESFNRISASQQWMGTWGNACYQGRIAGMNMAGKITKFTGTIPQHVSPVFSWTYMQIGDALRTGPKVRCESKGDPFKGAYWIKIYDDDILVGANIINNSNELSKIKKEILPGLTLQCKSES